MNGLSAVIYNLREYLYSEADFEGSIGSYSRANKFDINSKLIIASLLMLKQECINLHRKNIERLGVSEAKVSFDFYLHMECVVDQFLVFTINDEVTASLCNRGPLAELLIEVFKDEEKIGKNKYERYIPRLLMELFIVRANEIRFSSLLDFTISTFSAFEKWTSVIYEDVKEVYSDEERTVRFEEMIKKYNSDISEKKKNKIIDDVIRKCSSYVPSSNKIEYLLKMANNENYRGSVKDDLELVSFYRDQRNTVHSAGINESDKDKSIIVDGEEVTLKAGHGTQTKDIRTQFKMCHRLMKIYENIVDCIDFDEHKCCIKIIEN